MSNGIKNFLDSILNTVFVKKCVACKELLAHDSERMLCDACFEEWEDAKSEVCPDCLKEQIDCRCGVKSRYVDSVRHLALYSHYHTDSVPNRIVYALKRSNNDSVFDFVSDEMIKLLLPKTVYGNTVCVGVPRNPMAIRKYGYDHAKLLARIVAKKLGVEYADVLGHNGGRVEQKTLNSEQRIVNARKNCYVIPSMADCIKGKRVLLIDDIITTGASLSVCAELLKNNGALRVDCIVAARNERN